MSQIQQYVNAERLGDLALSFAPKILAALLVLAAFWALIRLTSPALRRVLDKADFDEALVHLLVDNVFRAALWTIAAVMMLSQLGVNVGAMIAGLGVAGVAIGFAAKDSLTNTIAGFLIFWDKPFRVGDYISTQDQYGEVTRITMRTTRIRTPNNTYVVIPNSEIIEDVLVNHSIHGNTRVVVPVGVSYATDLDEARDVLTEVAAATEGVLDDPAPSVVVSELADSSVNLGVRVWIEDAADERRVYFDLLERSKKALDEAGIEIPFPHLQLHVDSVKDPVWRRAAELELVGGESAQAS